MSERLNKLIDSCHTAHIFQMRYGGDFAAIFVYDSKELATNIIQTLGGGDNEAISLWSVLLDAKYPFVRADNVSELLDMLVKEFPNGVYGICGTPRHDFMCDFVPWLHDKLKGNVNYLEMPKELKEAALLITKE